MAQIGGENMIPGKVVTINTAILKADAAVSAFQNLADNPSHGGVYVTTKKQSSWVADECVYVILGKSGYVTSIYRYHGGSIAGVTSLTSSYDVKIAAGTKFYLVEVTTT